ncbi:MAG: diaminopropionate ammonia-lyase [Proteobacteria bacterium]|nr:diaminopropionate ammonia-lyase [Pseudomonadota bacterium]
MPKSDVGIANIYINNAWRRRNEFTSASPEMFDRAIAAITAEDGYAPTPLRSLPALASRLELGSVLCKDESCRFGVGGIKALGAPHGLRVLLEHRASNLPFVAAAATDGNHGLALAWAARRQGGGARIFVGRDVDTVRLARIRAQGAEIVVVDGTYDDAVLAAERAERDDGVLLVTDTDYQGDRLVGAAIMAGYGLVAEEAWTQGLCDAPPTHVFLQCGVGGVAAGIATALWRKSSPNVPRVVTVEPATAACVLASLRAGVPTTVDGDLRTRIAGLACGRMTTPAWTVLSRAAFAAIAIDDTVAKAVQSALVAGAWGDGPLSTWDTGVAGIAGLWAAAHDNKCRHLLQLDASSRVLVVNTEGPPADDEFGPLQGN